MTTTLHIKNMVCDRCIKVVQEELARLGMEVESINLGVAQVNFSAIDESRIIEALMSQGFELISDPDDLTVERIKLLLISLVSELPMQPHEKLSVLIARAIGKEYSSLSRLFSQKQQITIEKYYLKLKLEKVKALIQEGGLTFSEIAYQLDYSSVNHLANQFKSATGMNMTEYKLSLESDRNSLDKIV